MTTQVWIIEQLVDGAWTVYDMHKTRVMARIAQNKFYRFYPSESFRIRKYVPA